MIISSIVLSLNTFYIAYTVNHITFEFVGVTRSITPITYKKLLSYIYVNTHLNNYYYLPNS